MYALAVIPPYIDQQIAVMLPVKDRLGLNLPVGIRNPRVFHENGLYKLPICV
jgi:hypothetical protein